MPSIPATFTFFLGYIKEQNVRSTILSFPYNMSAILAGFSAEILTGCVTINGVNGMIAAGLVFSAYSILSTIGIACGTYWPYKSLNWHEYQLIDEKRGVRFIDENESQQEQNKNDV